MPVEQTEPRGVDSGDVESIKTKVDTLHDTRLTAARATKLDNVLSDTVWTGTKAGYLDAAVTSRATVAGIWDEAQSGHATAGTFGKILGDMNARLPGSGTLSTHSAADVWAAGTRTLTAAPALNANEWRSEAVTTFNNAALGTTETTIVEKGAVGGTDHYRLEGAFVNVAALGTGTTTVNLRVYVEVNGVSTALPAVARTTTGLVNLLKELGAITSRYIKVTVQRNEGSGTDGSVSASAETSKATA